ncbi:MAG: hypothetical protein KKA16_15180 [Alphaproteobacteria bacterium]|nr:hypothetical protein [Alphaproteobacteria bacterium]MBU2380058.1 hypothetical protein [Alphaproteobacteria bacterium]
MKHFRISAALAVSVALIASAAQAMTVQEFLAAAAGIPRNPTAMLRSDTRRLIAEVRGAVRTVNTERETAVAAGRPPAFCPPAGARVSISPDTLLARLNSIPVSRRNISVTQAMREWMADRYPCPAA